MTITHRFLISGLFVLLTVSCAWAGSEEDYAGATRAWEMGSREEATALFQKAIDAGLSGSRLSEARYDSAVYYFMSKQFDAAMEQINSLIEQEPENVSALGLRANIWVALGQTRGADTGSHALDDWARILDLDPEDANTYNDRGIYYAEQGELAKAIEDLSKFLALEPDNPDQKTYLAELEMALAKQKEKTDK